MKHRIINFLLLATVAVMLAGCDANKVGDNLSKLNRNLFFEPELNTDEGSNYSTANKTIGELPSTIEIGADTETGNAVNVITGLLDGKNTDLDVLQAALESIETAFGGTYAKINKVSASLSADLNSKEISTLVHKLDSTTVTVDENVKSQMILTAENASKIKGIVTSVKNSLKNDDNTKDLIDDSVFDSLETALEGISNALSKFTVTAVEGEENSYTTSLSSLVASTTLNGMVMTTLEKVFNYDPNDDPGVTTQDIFQAVDKAVENSLLVLDRLTETNAFTSMYGTVVNIATQARN